MQGEGIMGTIDFVLSAGAIVIGIMLLTGHGSVFLKGGDAERRKKLYDEEKLEKASGTAMLGIGIVTAIDHFTTSVSAKIGYVVVILVILAGLIYYLRTKCRK